MRMLPRILKKGKDHIYITDKHSSSSTVFADRFTIYDNTADNSIILSLDLTTSYKGNKQVNTYLDIVDLDADWSVVNLVEISNEQVSKGLNAYLHSRSNKPEKFYVHLTAKNQTTRQIVFEEGYGLRMRVID